jgi:hypothetical protein
MKLLLSLLFVFILTGVNAFAQIDYEKRAADFYKVQNFERALKDYEKALKKKPRDIEIVERIITCYQKANIVRSDMMPFVVKLQELKPFHPQLNYFFAQAFFYQSQFDKALDYLALYQKQADLKDAELAQASLLEKYVMNAQALTKKPLNVSFVNLGPLINTDRSELNPFISSDEKVLFYASDKRYLAELGINYFNVCYTLFADTGWLQGKNAGTKINSVYDQIVGGLSPDDKQIFVFHNQFGEELLATTQYNAPNKFGELVDLQVAVNHEGAEYGACYSASNDTLYFAAITSDNQSDILYSIKLPDKSWAEPRKIPGFVNSIYDENFPIISSDGKKLLFSSNNPASMGGYDLFYSLWNDSLKQWGKPYNVGYPVNDMYDNYTLSMARNKRYGYVSAIRPEGRGARDIYKVIFNDVEPPVVLYRYKMKNWSNWYKAGDDLPLVQVSNSQNQELVGQYRCSPVDGGFVVALSPGQYTLKLFVGGEEKYTETIKISEVTPGEPLVVKEIDCR